MNKIRAYIKLYTIYEQFRKLWDSAGHESITFLADLDDGLLALESSRQGHRQVVPSCKLEGKM